MRTAVVNVLVDKPDEREHEKESEFSSLNDKIWIMETVDELHS